MKVLFLPVIFLKVYLFYSGKVNKRVVFLLIYIKNKIIVVVGIVSDVSNALEENQFFVR